MLMKQISRFFMLVTLLFTLFGASNANAQAMKEILMPRWGKQVVEVSEEMLFYDYKGTGYINSSNSDNTLATIVFKPAEPGKVVQITFEDFDLRSDFGSYFGYANVYNGEVDPNNKFVYPETTSGVTSSSILPEGDVLEKLEGQYVNKTFISTASDGCLSVGCIFRYGKRSNGWVARVKTITVSDMSTTAAGGDNSKVLAAPTAKKGVALAGVYVDASGILNPVKLTEVSFTIPVNENVVDPTQLKLYSGIKSEFKDELPLNATISNEGSTYKFTLEEPLKENRNFFTIASDILPEAAFNANVKVDAIGVKTTDNPNGFSGFAKANAVNINLPYMVLMQKGISSYNVGNNAILFFDDGGKDGKISENFVGTTTFKPETPGMKIMIDFTKVTLFESSNKNEILNVYNGTEAKPENLICRIKNGVPEKIRSTSADGALTVTLTCDTGFPKDGFEATVSQFKPAAMTVESITASQESNLKACAGDSNVPALSFNIKTANTEPALTASKFTLTSNSTFANITKASIYYTGRSNKFSTAKKIGEAEVNADSYTINASVPTSLLEGDNYFWVTYDIASTVTNGQKVDAAIQAVTLSDKENAVANGNPNGEIIIENTVISKVGKVEKTVYGTWMFTSEKNPLSSYNGYNPVEGDQITTFVPGSKGMIIELDIKSFALYYSTSSWATKAKFEVYSGKDTKGELLWSLTNADDKDKGPGRIIRSKSADGALTVVFDANTTSSSYTAKGWTAEVREYKSVPMTIAGFSATQLVDGTVKIGAKNLEVIGFNIKTAGDLDPQKVSEITIDLKGSQVAVENAYLYYNGANADVVKNTPLETIAITPETKSAVFKLSAPISLLEGDNNFIVAYDISDTAPIDTQIDAAYTSAKINGLVATPEIKVGDPEGFGTIKNLFLLQKGENGEVTIGANSLMFYDFGGPDGKTPKDFEGTVTFAPQDAGKVIKMIFKKWKPNGNYDAMKIYYGGSATGKEDIKYQSQATLPADVVSKSPDGKLTVNFRSPSYSYASDGWEIEVCQYEMKALEVSEVTATAVAPLQVMRGMTDVAMLDVAVTVSGDKGELDFTSVEMSTEGTTETYINGISVFTTGLETTFSPVDKVMEANAAPYALNGSYKITSAGTYHFWLTYNVSSEAELMKRIKMSLKKVTVSNADYTPTQAVVAETKIQKGISGTLTVGEDSQYKTIQSAIDAIKGGIDGPVTINIKKGSYEEAVKVPEIPGASSTNTITLQSESGKRDDVVIFNDYYVEPPYSDDKMNDEYGVFTFDGVDYFTLKGVTVTTTDLNYPSVIHYRNQSRHVTVDNCHIFTKRSESASANQDIRLINQYAKNVANCNNDFPTIKNCLIEGGYIGVVIQGSSFVKLPKQKGGLVENNTFRDQGSKAFYSSSRERDLTLKGNVIENTTATKSGFYGVDVETSENFIFEGNSVFLATAENATAVNIRGIEGTQEKPGIITNNEISVVCPSATSAGIKLSSASSNVNIANNTVLMSGTKNNSAFGVALWLNNTTTNVTIVNNILVNTEGGYVYRFYKDNCIEGVTFSNNVVFTNGTGFAKSNPTTFANFTDWVATSGEKNSFNEEVKFYSATILTPTEAGNLQNALPLEYVKTDKDSTFRNATKPTIGAYEYSEYADVPAYSEGYPAFGGINNSSATAELMTDINATAFTLVKKASEPAPSTDELMATLNVVELRKGKVLSLKLTGLSRQTEYKLYSILMSLNGLGVSDVIASDVFTTTFDPTEVSTFENATTNEEGFRDGTAQFSNFTVETISDAVVDGDKAAKVGTNASVKLTNTDSGLVLTGFFLKSDKDVTIKTYNGQDEMKPYNLASTENSWSFINLKDKGYVTKIDFETTGNAFIDNFSGEPLPLTIKTSSKEVSVTAGENATVSVTANGGVAPFAYSWTDAMTTVIATTAECSVAKPEHSGIYDVTVTDAWGNTLNDRVTIYVAGPAFVATFDDNYLAPESYYNGLGKDNGDYTHPGTDSRFISGSYSFFTNRHTATWWGGFGLSNQTSVDFTGLNDQYKSAVGHGHNSANYGVAFAPESGSTYTIEVSNNRTEGDIVSGFYVTNAAYTANAIVNGDGMSNPNTGFEKGDYFKLIINAEKADGSTVSKDYYLADYRSDNSLDHFYLDSWQWVDLRSLGKVKNFKFAFEGTKRNAYGLTTPTYFCLDDFGGSREITDAQEQIVGTSSTRPISLSSLFAVESDGSSVEYAITDNCDASIATATISGDNLEILGAKDFDSGELIISAKQKGKLQFVRLPFSIDEYKFSSVETIETANVRIFPVPAVDWLNINTDMSDYDIEIMNAAGVCVFSSERNNGNTKVSVSNLSKGVYFLNMRNENSSITKRFIVK